MKRNLEKTIKKIRTQYNSKTRQENVSMSEAKPTHRHVGCLENEVKKSPKRTNLDMVTQIDATV
jgi:hypothetical protein